jgi:hypothetical protein
VKREKGEKAEAEAKVEEEEEELVRINYDPIPNFFGRSIRRVASEKKARSSEPKLPPVPPAMERVPLPG